MSPPAGEANLDPAAGHWRRVSFLTPILKLPSQLDSGRHPGIIGAIILLVFFLPLVLIYAYFRWKSIGYALIGDTLYYRSGIVLKNQRTAKFNRVQSINITQPLAARLFGLGQIEIEVAGGVDSNISIGYLKTTQLELLRQEILKEVARHLPTTLPPQANVQVAAPTVPTTVQPTQYSPTDSLLNAENEGQLIFTIPPSAMLRGAILDIGDAANRVFFILILAFASLTWATGGTDYRLWVILIMLVFAVPVNIYSTYKSNFNFRAYRTAEGIRIRAGLTQTHAQTIGLDRIHGLVIEQPYFWRKLGLYRVEIIQAGASTTDSKEAAPNLLLPLGTKTQMLYAVWMVFPHLGVENPVETLQLGLEGAGTGGGYINNPPRSRLFDWFTAGRKAHYLTENVLFIRSGKFDRRLTLMKLARIQKIRLSQGPLARLTRLADVSPQMVGIRNVFSADMGNVDAQLAKYLFVEIERRATQAAKQQRQAGKPKR
ncbi:MAG: PH domain-containing protein [Actinomycetaceae bacterium]|nr:PH domain-containing protein [Actinomycetaceae bacterium]